MVAVQEVVVFLQTRHLVHGISQQQQHVGEGIAVQTGRADHHVDARTLQLAVRNNLGASHLTLTVPHRLDAHGMHDLRFQRTLVTHGFQ